MKKKRRRTKAQTPALLDERDPGGDSDEEILTAISDEAFLFHTPSRESFASVPVGEHRENWPVRSREFALWLTKRFFDERRRAPNPALLRETLYQIEARAQFGAREEEVFLRVAGDARKISIDLCDREWRLIEVSRRGWKIVARPKVRFRRAPGMLPLPSPPHRGSIEELRPFLNLRSASSPADDWYLLVAWLTAALRPRGPYPILILGGEQGTGKSTTARLLRALIDPNAVPLRRPPRDERDLMIAAGNSWLVSMDNLSRIRTRFSDSLCALSTGGGFSTRRLFSDAEEALFSAQRPVLLNGIDDLAERGDLLDRSLLVSLPRVAERRRLAEETLWRRFEKAYPAIFSGVLETLSRALGELSRVRLRTLPRMADFARWGVACERALSWPEGTFLAAYERNLRAANDQAIEASSLGPAIVDFVRSQPRSRWVGTCSEFLDGLLEHAGGRMGGDRHWPRSPQQLGQRLRRLGVNLRRGGFEIRYWREGKQSTRMVSIRKVG